MVLLTIAIPSHNENTLFVENAIESIIYEPLFGKDINLIISDNSISNKTKILYESKYFSNNYIKYFNSKEYKSLDSNVNRAVQISDSEYVWIFGDDDLLIPGVLKKIISFIKINKPNFVVLNSQSFKNGDLIEESRVFNGAKKTYSQHENNKFLSDLGGYLTYVGCILVRRNLWIDNYDSSKIGTYFAHIDCIASIKNNSIAHYFFEPAILMRIGSQTWTSKSFLIWNFYYPELIWGLEGYSDKAKESVIKKEPCNSFASLLSKRAYGSLNFRVWRNYIMNSKNIFLIYKMFSLFITFIPIKIFSILYVVYILLYKNKQNSVFSPKLALATIK